MCLRNIWMPSKRKSKKMPKWWKTEEDPATLPRQWPRKPDKNRLWEKHCQIIQDLPPIFWNLPTGMERWGANMRRGMRCWLWKYPHHFLVKAVDRDGPGLQPHPDPLKVNSCYNHNKGYAGMLLTALGFYTFAGPWVISVSLGITRARAMLNYFDH